MQIKVIYPDDPKELEDLQNKIAEEHANIIVNYIQGLSCTDTEKIALFQYAKQKAAELS